MWPSPAQSRALNNYGVNPSLLKKGFNDKEELQDLFDKVVPAFEAFTEGHGGKKPLTGKQPNAWL